MSPTPPNESTSIPKPGPHLYLRGSGAAQSSADADGKVAVSGTEPFKLVDIAVPDLERPSLFEQTMPISDEGVAESMGQSTYLGCGPVAESDDAHSENPVRQVFVEGGKERVEGGNLLPVRQVAEAAVEATAKAAEETAKKLRLPVGLSKAGRHLRAQLAQELKECPQVSGVYPTRLALWQATSQAADPELISLDESEHSCQVRVGISSSYRVDQALKEVAQRITTVMRQAGMSKPKVHLTAVTVE